MSPSPEPERKPLDFIVERTPAEIDFEAILAAGRGEARELAFQLERGMPPVVGTIRRTDRRSEHAFTLHGKFEGAQSDGWWTLNRNHGVVAANFHLPDEGPYYEWRHTAARVHEQRLIDVSAFPQCASGTLAHLVAAAERAGEVDDLPPMLADGPMILNGGVAIDNGQIQPAGGNGGVQPQLFLHQVAVMVVYTPASVAEIGGAVAMEGLVFLAMDETNAAFADSRVRPRLHLVHHQQIAYAETNNLRTDLIQLARASDGHIDFVHDLRDAHGADIVHMIVENSGSCGLGLTTVNPAQPGAFSVSARDCTASNYTFAHEIAHNFGCLHARGDSGAIDGPTLYDFAHGFRFEVAGAGGDVLVSRTIMAQNPGRRIPFFSNPNVLFEGAAIGRPMGAPDAAFNARALSESASMVAGWRATPAVQFGDRLGQPDWQFVTGGNAPWTFERENAAVPNAANNGGVHAGRLQSNGSSWLQTTVQGPLQVNFAWRLERTNANSDAYLSVGVDDVEFMRIDSTTDWENAFVRVPAGSHTIRWNQHRGEGGRAMDSQGWIGNITAEVPPFRIREVWTENDGPNHLGALHMLFDSIPGQRYEVEGSRNGREWIPVRNVFNDDPGVYVSEISLPAPAVPEPDEFRPDRIYRIRMVD